MFIREERMAVDNRYNVAVTQSAEVIAPMGVLPRLHRGLLRCCPTGPRLRHLASCRASAWVGEAQTHKVW